MKHSRSIDVKFRCALVVLALMASFGAGCSESITAPTPVSLQNGSVSVAAADLEGTWILQSVQASGHAVQPTPIGATYTITFTDGRLSTRADCNVCNGPFSLSADRFTAGPTLACTRAACRTMEFEHAYTGLLGGEGTLRLVGGTLVLSS